MSDLINEMLSVATFRRGDIEAVLSPQKESWCSFDSEIGYVPRDIILKDGMDFCYTTYTHETAGQRRMVNYGDHPCRINTYGDSFTQSQQVSDDETWQERLAAHIGEPLRNFGCGGYSLYAACRRSMRMEATESSADYIVLTVYDDDHVRSLDASRWLRTHWGDKDRPRDRAWPLHGLPWAHVRFDLETGKFVEKPGICKNEADLLALCDPVHFRNTFKDDQILRLFSLEQGGETDFSDLESIAEALGIQVNLRDSARRRSEATKLRIKYGFKASEYILDRFFPWVESQGKKIFVPLAYSESHIINYLKTGERFDEEFLDYLKKMDIKFFDCLKMHKEDYADFNLQPEKYIDRYFIKPAAAAVFGHYNPMGNLLFAMALKGDLVNWLNPKPPAYNWTADLTDFFGPS